MSGEPSFQTHVDFEDEGCSQARPPISSWILMGKQKSGLRQRAGEAAACQRTILPRNHQADVDRLIVQRQCRSVDLLTLLSPISVGI